jgi:hypothetical protein
VEKVREQKGREGVQACNSLRKWNKPMGCVMKVTNSDKSLEETRKAQYVSEREIRAEKTRQKTEKSLL